MKQFAISERRACRLVELDRSSYRCEPRADHNAQLREELVKRARQKPRYGYRRLHVLLDAFTRECLTLEVDTSLSSQRVTRALEQAVEQRGMPESIRCDNGPELTSRHFLGWCEERARSS
jgi:transposase InsO family protein